MKRQQNETLCIFKHQVCWRSRYIFEHCMS